MSQTTLTIDLDAIIANWRALDAMSAGETAAVVKADAYGLGMAQVAPALARAGTRQFFVAMAQEGANLRKILGEGPRIFVFNGYAPDEQMLFAEAALVPLLNSPEQFTAFTRDLSGAPYGVQLDTGMNRLGLEGEDWGALAAEATPALIISHLACADAQGHPMNDTQRRNFEQMTIECDAPRSLGATGGIIMGPDYHFDLTRPGIGLYGGQPFSDARPVVTLEAPVIQIRNLGIGESVGYGNTWQAARPSRIATLALGYADGVHRALSNGAMFFWDVTPCPLVGRVSMDLITVDVTDAQGDPAALTLLNELQTIDELAHSAGTIGYEILTSLGTRFNRRYKGG